MDQASVYVAVGLTLQFTGVANREEIVVYVSLALPLVPRGTLLYPV